MNDIDRKAKWRSPHWGIMLGIGGLLAVGGGIAYQQWFSRPIEQPSAVAAKPVPETVSALGRLEPEGTTIHVFAPTATEGARVESLKVSHGQQVRKGDIIAVLDTYARRQSAVRSAQQELGVARSKLAQVKAGAKQGEIQAQQATIGRLQAERDTQTAAQQATLARVITETNTQTASQQATVAKIVAETATQIDAQKAAVAEAQANVAQAQANLDAAIVRSPQDGKVLKIHTRAGERVGNDGIISLGQTDRMVAVAEVYELDLSRIRSGQSATVTSKNNAFADVLHGKVVEVGLEINKKDVLNTDPAAKFDARVVEVKVLLDEPSSRRVAGLTNLSIQVAIDVKS